MSLMETLQTLNLLPIFILANLFAKISGSNPIHPVLTGPDMAYLGSKVTFNCIAPNSSMPVTYQLIGDSGVPIATGTNLQGQHPASFFLKVAAASEGLYHCKAMTKGSTGVSNSIKLSVVTPPTTTRVTSEPPPPIVYEGSRIVLNCSVAKGSHLSYTWFFNKQEITSSFSPSFHHAGNKLVMEMVTPEQAGHYYCEAWSSVMGNRRVSSSTEVQVLVKVYISKPKISFSVYKEGDSYYGNVTCWSLRGSPPAHFTLRVDDKEVGSVTANESLAAWFSIAIIPGLDMGMARCLVTTEVQALISEPVTLEVVPVGGDVKVEVEYLYRADSKLVATILSCQVSRGTFPYISWLLNDSVLPSETHVDSFIQPVLPHYAVMDGGQTLILTKLSLEQSGYYRCRAKDSYNDLGPSVESAAVLVQVTEFLMTTIEIITTVFCCFLFLMLIVCVACLYRMLDHKQAVTHVATKNSDAIPLSALTSQSGGKQADTSPTNCDAQNQVHKLRKHIHSAYKQSLRLVHHDIKAQ
ncbi:Fc receptor-like protein 5 isoform X2 [Mastacembelus armatus]|uniref:Fc receptor-like protein 5 isoform X2 n=1 Tax=Mastacembelus armatus TaxID=205130 RepID=UPI000E453DCB|nr:Fc receptor-like protein 5 isoform X2 [Mastacembelus armatus]